MRVSVLIGLFSLCILCITPASFAECLFAWDAVPLNPGSGYSLFGQMTPFTETEPLPGKTYENFVRIPLTALLDPAHPTYTVPCQELSYWRATAWRANGLQSPFSNQIQVPQVLPSAPLGFSLEWVTITTTAPATVTTEHTLRKSTRK